MALPFSYRPNARLFIGDTGALMIDVVQATRRGQLTSLLAAIHHDAALLYIARHVLVEVERDLPVYSQRLKRPVDPDAAMNTWQTLYAPHIRVVDVPEPWGADDRNVQAVAARDDDDLPTAQLAFALSPCYGIAVDPDLVDNSYGHADLLPMLHVAANDAEMNLAHQMAAAPVVIGGLVVYAAFQVVRQLPALVQVGLLFGAGFVGYRWQRDGHAKRHLQRIGAFAADVWKDVSPLLTEIYERRRAGEAVWNDYLVQTTCPPGLSEQVARVLAFAGDEGMLATEIVEELELPGSIKTRAAAVRAVLRECEAFTEVSRGRWRLGHPVSEIRHPLFGDLTVDWLQRAHRKPAGQSVSVKLREAAVARASAP